MIPATPKPRKPRPPTEHAEQVAFVAWFRLRFRNVRIIAIPNGGSRHIIVARKLKAEGVVSGVPDLFVPEWRLWIEMKRRSGSKILPEQRDWAEYLESVGYSVIFAKGAAEARRLVEAFAPTAQSLAIPRAACFAKSARP